MEFRNSESRMGCRKAEPASISSARRRPRFAMTVFSRAASTPGRDWNSFKCVRCRSSSLSASERMSLRVVMDRMSSRPDIAARALAAVAISLWYSAWLYRKSRRMKVRIRSLSGCSKRIVPSLVSKTGCATCCWVSFIPLLCLTWGLARQSAVAGMEGFDLLAHALQVAVVHNHIISDGQPRLTGGLRGQHRPRLGQRHAVADLHPPQLQLLGAVHQQHPVHAGAEVMLDQQRNDPYLIGAHGRLRAALQFRHDGRVHQSLQRCAVCGLSKDPLAQGAAVKLAGGGEQLRAKVADHA